MNAPDIHRGLVAGTPSPRQIYGAALRERLAQLRALVDYYRKRGAANDVEFYEAQIAELEGAT